MHIHLRGKFITARDTLFTDNLITPTIYHTYLVDGLPVMNHETSATADYHMFMVYLPNGNTDDSAFYASHNNLNAELCVQLQAQSEKLRTDCSNLLEINHGEPTMTSLRHALTWWRASGDKGSTWMHGKNPVVTLDPQGHVMARWDENYITQARCRGIFDLLKLAA